ncbi:hypothetical protein FQN50_001427 [Emmonsiellopsis sp. PD_5]|nr:hypothetical protein FQN50_001427 [Emmonsiellopsis sp. PD_5]
MSLNNLPPELIDQILSDHCLKRYDLASLALVNRRLSKAVLPALYRDVTLYRNFKGPSSSFTDLIRTVTARPELAKYTRSVSVVSISSGLDVEIDALRLFHSIESLRVNATARLDLACVLPANPLAKLQCLEFYTPLPIPFDDMARFIQLPALESLTVGRELETSSEPASSVRKIEHRSSLKTLIISASSDYSAGLDLLLPNCPALTLFAYIIKKPTNTYLGDVHPGPLSQVLSHCRETLVSLELGYQNDESVGEETAFDLTCLTNLKTLRANSIFLFQKPADSNPADRQGFYSRLPPSLETLKITFPRSRCAFRSKDDPEPERYLDMKFKDINLLWLAEIAQYKHARLSNISFVCIKEVPCRSCVMAPTSADCDPPPIIENTFRDAGIAIDLSLRLAQPRIGPRTYISVSVPGLA